MEDSPFYNHDVVEISNTGTQYVVLQTENTREAVHVKNDYFSQYFLSCGDFVIAILAAESLLTLISITLHQPFHCQGFLIDE